MKRGEEIWSRPFCDDPSSENKYTSIFSFSKHNCSQRKRVHVGLFMHTSSSLDMLCLFEVLEIEEMTFFMPVDKVLKNYNLKILEYYKHPSLSHALFHRFSLSL